MGEPCVTAGSSGWDDRGWGVLSGAVPYAPEMDSCLIWGQHVAAWPSESNRHGFQYWLSIFAV